MRFSTDLRFGSLRAAREPGVHASSLVLDVPAGGTGFFLTVFELEARTSKGEMKSNMDLRGDGGVCCWG